MVFAEPLGDDERMVMSLPLVEIIFTVDFLARRIMVCVREIQVKALHDFDRYTPHYRIGAYICQSVEHPTKRVIVEFGNRDILAQQMLNIFVHKELLEPKQRTASR